MIHEMLKSDYRNNVETCQKVSGILLLCAWTAYWTRGAMHRSGHDFHDTRLAISWLINSCTNRSVNVINDRQYNNYAKNALNNRYMRSTSKLYQKFTEQCHWVLENSEKNKIVKQYCWCIVQAMILIMTTIIIMAAQTPLSYRGHTLRRQGEIYFATLCLSR